MNNQPQVFKNSHSNKAAADIQTNDGKRRDLRICLKQRMQPSKTLKQKHHSEEYGIPKENIIPVIISDTFQVEEDTMSDMKRNYTNHLRTLARIGWAIAFSHSMRSALYYKC